MDIDIKKDVKYFIMFTQDEMDTLVRMLKSYDKEVLSLLPAKNYDETSLIDELESAQTRGLR